MQTLTRLAGILLLIILTACKDREAYELNAVQYIGSHNSYKIGIEQPLWDYLYQKDSSRALSLQYHHIPLAEQLELGLRNLELDVFYDPEGGHFSDPKGLQIIKEQGFEPLPFDKEGELSEKGLKLFHIQDIDFRSHHLLFKNALEAIKAWSDAQESHHPVVILINAKDKKIPGLTSPLEFTASALKSIDDEINSVFSEERLITPKQVQGNYSSLEQAILEKGWPILSDLDKCFLFVLDEKEEKIKRYLSNYKDARDALLFVNAKEGNPQAAFRIVNDPVDDFDYIQSLVGQGYIVRTRADAGTRESRILDYTPFQKAMDSGAQIISTDYYIKTNLFSSSFQVVFPEGGYERVFSRRKTDKSIR